MKKYELKLDRRDFLKKSGMIGMTAIAPGVFLQDLAHGRAVSYTHLTLPTKA